MNQSLDDLAQKIITEKAINADEVKLIRQHVFSEAKILERALEDGVVDRHEAETLFAINDAVTDGTSDESWPTLFIEALTSHVLKDEISPETLDTDEARFLVTMVVKDAKVDAAELELMVNVSASVKSAPPFFHQFVLTALKEAIIRDGVVDEHDVQMIRRVIFASGSSAGAALSALERELLFDIQRATRESDNHPSWSALQAEVNLPPLPIQP